jgi:hypothetical protein
MNQGRKQVYDVPLVAQACPAGGTGVKFPELGDKLSLDEPNRPNRM